MEQKLVVALALFLSYLLGSLPTAYLLGKFLKGVDIREHGSGNPGATNVFRVIGPAAGVLTLVVDFAKGFLPVKLASAFIENLSTLAWIGLFAIFGHIWPIFLKFRGGKGVITAAGVFMAILPIPTLIALATFLLVLLLTRYVSLGSICGAIALAVSTWIISDSKFLISLVTASSLLIIFLHHQNILRLVRGQENKAPLWK